MRTRYVQLPNGKLVQIDECPATDHVSPIVIGDIEPYQSMIDGSMITSRSKHREHLRQHGCVELGNEVNHLTAPRERPDVAAKERKELIVAQMQALGHEGFKRAIKRDVDFVKWNSNK